MKRIYQGTLGLIGNTPLVEMVNLEKKYGLDAVILAKLEYLNPAGSVKDRAAKEMIEDAEKRGILREGSVIIEPTSGNTGNRAGCDCSGKRISDDPDYAGDHEHRAQKYAKSLRRGGCAD